MELRQVAIFCALARERNFTRTAERMHTVQSNVTAQIRTLEEELGTLLFDRFPRNVVLTEAGKRFLPHAQRMLTAMEEGERAVQNGHELAGPLRVGAPESVLTYRLPRVVKDFQRKYPKIELIFRPYVTGRLVRTMEAGSLDLAVVMADEIDPRHLVSRRLRREKVFLFAGAAHPLAGKKVTGKELEAQVLLLTEADCGYRKKLDEVLAAERIRLQSVTEFSSVEAIKMCAMAGMGIGLLPEIVIAAELKAGKLKTLEWEGKDLSIATHLLWHKGKWISPCMEAFVRVVTEDLLENDGRARGKGAEDRG
jgi:DNA-binding transcriptional LysR family regulator